MSIFVEIGTTIVSLRKEKGLTQEQLALECEISVSYLRRIEHGEANPTIHALWRLAEVLEVELQNPLAGAVTAEAAGLGGGGRGGPSPRRPFAGLWPLWRSSSSAAGRPTRSAPGAGSPWSGSTRIFVTAAGRRWIGGSMPMRGSCWYLGV